MNLTRTVSLQFLGASGTVTGSKYLLKTPSYNFLIDCGIFQGLKDLRLKNWQPLPIDIPNISSVILTHAHLDHCGYLPLLGKQGFDGKIYCTAPTRDLTEVILRDSARIQEEDAAHANRIGYTKHTPAVPLYTEKDVERILPMLTPVEIDEKIHLTPDIHLVFKSNGHILGSAFVEINCFGRQLLFSGDLGRPFSTLLPPPSIPTSADYLVMESTYGDRLHPQQLPADELAKVIIEMIRKKGNLLIPSFAVGRAQELMHLINELKEKNAIPNIPVFMDSPMGADATRIFRKNPRWHKLNEAQCNAFFEEVKIISDFQETLKVVDSPGPKIIIAASGMLTGGRVLFYLEKYIKNKKNSILFTGYQSEGTRGRALLNGAHELKIHGAYLPVRLQVFSLGSMSGHADQKEMLDWLSSLKTTPQKVFLVHGENTAREAFRVKIETALKWNVKLPQWLEEVELFAV